MLGRYRLCFEIGSGGMAVVYLARTEGAAGFDKVVALKCIHPHLAREQGFVDMFLDEARIVSRIEHSNVCSVFDFGEVDGTYYMAMEYLMGETLQSVLRRAWSSPDPIRSPMYIGHVCRIVAEACEGLHAAHDLRADDGTPLHVVHRDISPSNVFVTYDGGVRIVDFGIARATERIHHTATGTIKGKVAYMAPEQMRGAHVDRRSDVWSLGVVLWQALTGRRPFRGKNDAETILAVLTAKIPKPSSVRAAIPDELDRVVLRALARDPEDRYATARDLGRSLGRIGTSVAGPIAAPEIAEWMHGMFAEEQAEAAQLVRIARQMGGPAVPRIATATEISSTSIEVADAPTLVDGPPRRTRTIAIATVALTLVASAGVGAMMASRPVEPDIGAPADRDGDNEPGAPPAPASARTRPRDPPAPEAAPPPTPPPGQPAAPDPARVQPSVPRTARPMPAPASRRAPATDTRSPAEPQSPGTVTVITPGGWADVYLGGSRLGRSPGRFSIPPGRHVLKLVPFGNGSPRNATTTVTPNGSSRVIVRLEDGS